jgi:hypothetical protein
LASKCLANMVLKKSVPVIFEPPCNTSGWITLNYRHTLGICTTYCFSAARLVTLTRLNAAFLRTLFWSSFILCLSWISTYNACGIRFGYFGVGERKLKNAGLNGSKNSPCQEEYRFDLLLSVPDILTVAQFRIIC